MMEKETAKTGRAVLWAFITALFIKIFLFDFMIAEGQSMIPAIKPGSVLLVNKLIYGLRLPGSGAYLVRWSLPKRGDVVIFYTPNGDIAVKRCAGLNGEGDFFALGDNSLLSYDSRSYGPIPADSIIGKALGIK
jgi:signal peptidase I